MMRKKSGSGFVVVSLLCILSVVIIWCSNSMITLFGAVHSARVRAVHQQHMRSCEALLRYGIDFCVKEYEYLHLEKGDVTLTFDQWPLHHQLHGSGNLIIHPQTNWLQVSASIRNGAQHMRMSCVVSKKGDGYAIEQWAYA